LFVFGFRSPSYCEPCSTDAAERGTAWEGTVGQHSRAKKDNFLHRRKKLGIFTFRAWLYLYLIHIIAQRRVFCKGICEKNLNIYAKKTYRNFGESCIFFWRIFRKKPTRTNAAARPPRLLFFENSAVCTNKISVLHKGKKALFPYKRDGTHRPSCFSP